MPDMAVSESLGADWVVRVCIGPEAILVSCGTYVPSSAFYCSIWYLPGSGQNAPVTVVDHLGYPVFGIDPVYETCLFYHKFLE